MFSTTGCPQCTMVRFGPQPTRHARLWNSPWSNNKCSRSCSRDLGNSGTDLWMRDPTIFLGRSASVMPLGSTTCSGAEGSSDLPIGNGFWGTTPITGSNVQHILFRKFNRELIWSLQGSHTSQMRKFKGISRVIKGSTAHFQGYFWKIVVTLGVNKISSDCSHLFQDCFGLCSILRRFQYFFLKNSWWQNSMKFRKKKRYLCWSNFCVFHNFQGDSRFLYKIPGYFQGSRSQNKF